MIDLSGDEGGFKDEETLNGEIDLTLTAFSRFNVMSKIN